MNYIRKLLNTFNLKLRQICNIGFEIVQVHWKIWFELSKVGNFEIRLIQR